MHHYRLTQHRRLKVDLHHVVFKAYSVFNDSAVADHLKWQACALTYMTPLLAMCYIISQPIVIVQQCWI